MHWREFQRAQKVVELGGRFVSYVEAGEGSPVVLVHGAPTWGYLWHRVLPALEKAHRVLIPDLPGYGWSDKAEGFDRSLARQAAYLAEFLDVMGAARADFVGHDAGAAAVLRLAAARPDRVGRLAVIGAMAYDAGPAGAGKAPREVLREGFISPDEELVEGLFAPYATQAGARSLEAGAGALDPSHFLEVLPRLSVLPAQTLVLWGERDALRPVAHGRRLAWDLPRARFELIAGAGHYAPLERPVETAGRLQDYLALGLTEAEPSAGIARVRAGQRE